jgi:predicted metal-binding protein
MTEFIVAKLKQKRAIFLVILAAIGLVYFAANPKPQTQQEQVTASETEKKNPANVDNAAAMKVFARDCKRDLAALSPHAQWLVGFYIGLAETEHGADAVEAATQRWTESGDGMCPAYRRAAEEISSMMGKK